MNQTQRTKAFESLGLFIRNLSKEDIETLAQNARNENTWFTEESVSHALEGLLEFLSGTKLTQWVGAYPEVVSPKKVALILAGNIPLVGFHDLLCSLILGHNVQVKLSSKDKYLVKYFIDKLIEIEPSFSSKVTLIEQLKNFDAVIATGSDNSARYFEYYFGKYPHIIRKNRISVAILNGTESDEDLKQLGSDVFTYYGLGCRNVSKLFVPADFRFEDLFPHWEPYSDIINHHKYANNYDYQKSILLINRIQFLDNGFVHLQESDKIVSPISVVYFERYDSGESLKEKISAHSEKIQVIVGNTSLCNSKFGIAQYPQLTDYADKVDTMAFLASLN